MSKSLSCASEKIGKDGFFTTGFAGAKIAAAADKVWAFVGDWGGLQKLLPEEIVRMETSGDGKTIGDTRTIWLPPEITPHQTVEVLEEYDDLRRRYAYSLLDSAGAGLAQYYGVFEVQADGPDACLVSYICRFLSLGSSSEEAANESLSSSMTLFENVAKMLNVEAN